MVWNFDYAIWRVILNNFRSFDNNPREGVARQRFNRITLLFSHKTKDRDKLAMLLFAEPTITHI